MTDNLDGEGLGPGAAFVSKLSNAPTGGRKREADKSEDPARYGKRRTAAKGKSDATVLTVCQPEEIDDLVSGLIRISKGRGLEAHFFDILREIDGSERRILVAKSMRDHLRQDEVAVFVHGVMTEGLIHKDYLSTLKDLQFFQVDPMLCVDFAVSDVRSKKLLSHFVLQFQQQQIAEVIERLCKMVNWQPKNIAGAIRSIDAFPNDYRSGCSPEEVFRVGWLMELARDLCDIVDLPLPSAL